MQGHFHEIQTFFAVTNEPESDDKMSEFIEIKMSLRFLWLKFITLLILTRIFLKLFIFLFRFFLKSERPFPCQIQPWFCPISVPRDSLHIYINFHM